jgi:hypothetical protein
VVVTVCAGDDAVVVVAVAVAVVAVVVVDDGDDVDEADEYDDDDDEWQPSLSLPALRFQPLMLQA